MGKIRWLSGVVVWAMLASVARPALAAPLKADAYDHTIRVEYVGDSITFGSRVEDREKSCYPARLGADVIDPYTPLSGHAEMFPDLVHPNAKGAALIAAAVYGELAGKGQAPAAIAKITVEAGTQDRIDTPVSVELKDVKLPGGPVQLVEVKGAQRVATPCQVEAGEPATLSWVLSGKTEAGTTRSFELIAGAAPADSQVKLNEDQTGIDIISHGAEVLRYYHGVMPPPPGQAKEYARSGFVHPLCAPSGAVLTAIHPKDHIHHMGIWNPWTSTEFEGRHVDFWNLKDATGTVRFVKYLSKTAGPVFGGFRAAQEHVDLKAPGGEKVALNEVFEVKVWNVGGPEKHYWIVDFTSTQRCASNSPLKLLAYRYGGFGFRATEEWNIRNSDYLTSEGKTRKDGHATRAKWCLTYGQTSKGNAGIEFMSHPGNREHPEPMRIWPDGYIFFNFCPIQQKEWTLEPGKDYTLRYRLYVYDGKLSAQEAERLWRDYGDGPVVKIAGK